VKKKKGGVRFGRTRDERENRERRKRKVESSLTVLPQAGGGGEVTFFRRRIGAEDC